MENGKVMFKRWGNIVAGLAAVIGVRYLDKKLLVQRNEQLYKLNVQRDILDHMLTLKQNQLNMDVYLKKMGYRRVGIYGLTMLGSHVYEELHESDYIIRLVGIDRREICDNYDMNIYKPEENFNPLDLIIVTVLNGYEGIASKLGETFSGKIMSIQQIINECETIYFDGTVYNEKETRNPCDL
ncbi:MAG: hypothetical protein NC548_21025 [Lachnospiraceae bacterium]|nr:hypothetical protein [Lachnospiraceae bacterium]